MRSGAKKKRPSTDDLADKELLAAVDKAVVRAMKPLLGEVPGLRCLQAHHVTAISVAAIAEYIAVRQLLEVREELNDDISDVGVA